MKQNLFKKVTESLAGFFKKYKKVRKVKERKVNKVIKRVELLKMELGQVTKAYDEKIAEIQKLHNKALWKYEQAYQKLLQMNIKHQQGLLSEEELEKQHQEVLPLENSLNKITEQLNQVIQYKQDSVIRIVSEIDNLKEKYTESLAEEIKMKSVKIQKQKQAYLKSVQSIGYEYKNVLETERLLKETFESYSFTYKGTMTDSLTLLTENVPVSLDNLVIENEVVNEALIGKIPYL
ncbi:hypothetical protein C2I27_16540 [Priestia megaterium]|uniref:hypothetical protein n=1 Tax=Priestia megaterium TaxID=1404 RepID=UPI000D51B9DF|nr:hypothetical protein [Priestia megaterium]PVC67414.1 hypothetical protein C2I27_16540 [Priestia megaterium]